MIHVARFCRGLHGIRTMSDCKAREQKAYEESCKGMSDYNRCVKCGVYLGCNRPELQGTKGGRVIDLQPSCKPADVGLSTKPLSN